MSDKETSSVAPDPNLLREALAQYRAWNEAEFEEQVRNAGKKTPAEKWREYKSLFALGRRLKPEQGACAQVMAALEWDDYYEQMRRFEARRQARG
jgi:hypothetical protein